jgi:hypothetical protein
MNDEFEQQRCERDRAEGVRYARSTVFVSVATAQVGRYDFSRHRFPIDVSGVVRTEPDGDWSRRRQGPGREIWEVGEGMMFVTPSPVHPRRRLAPRDWVSVTRTAIGFDDDADAERWRARLPEDGVLAAFLVYRVVGTWTVRIPPSAPSGAALQVLRSWSRLSGLPLTGATPAQSVTGVRIRVLGFAVLGPASDEAGSRVLDRAVLPGVRGAERSVAADVLDRLAGGFDREARAIEGSDTQPPANPEEGTSAPAPDGDGQAVAAGTEGFAGVVRAHERDLAICQLAAPDPPDGGRATLEGWVDVEVDGAGAVSAVSVLLEPRSPDAASCVESEVRTWRFPAEGPGHFRFSLAISGLAGASGR